MKLEEINDNLVVNKHEEVNQFLRHKASTGFAESSLVRYSRSLQYLFHDYMPDISPQEMEIYHIEQFLQELSSNFHSEISVNQSMTNKTKRCYLTHISSFYNYCLKRPSFPEITANPAKVVLEDIPNEHRDRPEPANWSNAVELVKAFDDPRNRLAALIMLKTGCRLQELLDLKPRDMKLGEGKILFRDRKNGRSTEFPIDQETVNAVKKYRMMRRQENPPYFFMSKLDNQLSKSRIQDKVREKAVEAEVMPENPSDFYQKFSPHTFRTVFTTVLRESDMPDHYISYLRGDSMKGSNMLDHYAKVNYSNVRKSYLENMKEVNI